MPEKLTLSHKSALVTGGSRGIGKATAFALAKAGAHVIVHYGMSAQEANAAVEHIQASGGNAGVAAEDLAALYGAENLPASLWLTLKKGLDVLALNAGISKAAPLKDYTVEDFGALFATNHAGTEKDRATRRCSRCHCLSGLAERAQDYRRKHTSRWRDEALVRPKQSREL